LATVRIGREWEVEVNPKPIGMRRTVQLLVIITLLVWATQTLVSQWGFGGIILTENVISTSPATAADSSVQAPEPTLELRTDASPAAATTQPSDATGVAADNTVIADAKQTALRDLLVSDLIDRLHLPFDGVKVTFEDRDVPTLILTSPRCRFDIDSSKAGSL